MSLNRHIITLIAATVFSFIGGQKASAESGRHPLPPNPSLFVVDLLCEDDQALKGIDQNGEKVCVDLNAPTREVGGSIVNAFHKISAAQCNSDDKVVGGRCQCHAAGLWLSGIVGNGYQCACNANPDYVGAVALCQKILR